VTPKQESRPSQLKKENQDSSKSLAITNTTLTPPSFPFPVNNNVKSQRLNHPGNAGPIQTNNAAGCRVA
ncbi:MAG: hypothetical protein ACK5YG_06180, partial [Alphaproteobacteria bacterium]